MPQEFFLGVLQAGEDQRIGPDHLPLIIKDEKKILQGIEESLELFLALPQGFLRPELGDGGPDLGGHGAQEGRNLPRPAFSSTGSQEKGPEDLSLGAKGDDGQGLEPVALLQKGVGGEPQGAGGDEDPLARDHQAMELRFGGVIPPFGGSFLRQPQGVDQMKPVVFHEVQSSRVQLRSAQGGVQAELQGLGEGAHRRQGQGQVALGPKVSLADLAGGYADDGARDAAGLSLDVPLHRLPPGEDPDPLAVFAPQAEGALIDGSLPRQVATQGVPHWGGILGVGDAFPREG